MLFANQTRPADESNQSSTQPFSQAEQLPSLLHSAFPPAMLASPPFSSASSAASSSAASDGCSSHRPTPSPPLSSSLLSSGSYSPSATLAPVHASPPLDGTLRVALEDDCLDESSSPLAPLPPQLPASSGVHSLRSISTTGRRSLTTSFSDLPHFAPAESTSSSMSNPATNSSSSRAARIPPMVAQLTPVDANDPTITR